MAAAITRERLKAKMDAGEDFVLVDVLSAESYRERHLPRAISVPLSTLGETAAQSLDRSKEIIVYCTSFQCMASRMAAQRLEDYGFKRVLAFEGGLADWEEAGFPFESA